MKNIKFYEQRASKNKKKHNSTTKYFFNLRFPQKNDYLRFLKFV